MQERQQEYQKQLPALMIHEKPEGFHKKHIGFHRNADELPCLSSQANRRKSSTEIQSSPSEPSPRQLSLRGIPHGSLK